MTESFRLTEADWAQQREQLLAIRFEVFVDEQGVPPQLEEDEADPRARHLLVLAGDATPVATARLLDDGHIGRMAVRKPYRGQGIGSRMLAALIDMAAQAGLQEVVLNAQCSAGDFYRRAGFIPQGEVFDDAGIPHRRMHRRLDPPAT